MKYLSIILLIIFSFGSCKTDKKQSKSIDIKAPESLNQTENIKENVDTIHDQKVREIKPDTRIDLNEILSLDKNDYLASFSNGNLELCCYYEIIDLSESIIRSNFKKTIETYNSEDKTDTVFVYKSETSFFKEYYNHHPKVNRLDLVYGEIFDESHIDDKRVEIGQNKIKFLEQFFLPSKKMNEIKQFSISEDELGEAETIFKFEEDKLKMIIFNSSYSWINKKLEK
ncbi:hypothetical protein Q4Q35_02125 [Flavivirga aquimarina]|uniref:Lipoprotein n=1 Tax=Flavivirga aquimarina TaxID=2027862 RepID=A0ABT8W649_9FLAO|nr:hypothetical protein [Flavivirga aquimarina]MDO5968593.1 hypothetical protein [Flavivirga aquimarina]